MSFESVVIEGFFFFKRDLFEEKAEREILAAYY